MKVEMSFEMPEWLQCLLGDIDTSIVVAIRKEDAELIEIII